eukprot:scaffold99737_cov33-Tisochrysis_lutea.AAC.4
MARTSMLGMDVLICAGEASRAGEGASARRPRGRGGAPARTWRRTAWARAAWRSPARRCRWRVRPSRPHPRRAA